MMQACQSIQSIKMENNKLIDYLLWTRNDGTRFREFKSVIEIHYFLLGYQKSESDNAVKNGDGFWVDKFMQYCEREKIKISSRSQHGDCNSGESYYLCIHKVQRDDEEGLGLFYGLLDRYLSEE